MTNDHSNNVVIQLKWDNEVEEDVQHAESVIEVRNLGDKEEDDEDEEKSETDDESESEDSMDDEDSDTDEVSE